MIPFHKVSKHLSYYNPNIKVNFFSAIPVLISVMLNLECRTSITSGFSIFVLFSDATFKNMWLDSWQRTEKNFDVSVLLLRVPNSRLPKCYKEVFIKLGYVLFGNFKNTIFFTCFCRSLQRDWLAFYSLITVSKLSVSQSFSQN